MKSQGGRERPVKQKEQVVSPLFSHSIFYPDHKAVSLPGRAQR
jgi:hypothetical protein